MTSLAIDISSLLSDESDYSPPPGIPNPAVTLDRERYHTTEEKKSCGPLADESILIYMDHIGGLTPNWSPGRNVPCPAMEHEHDRSSPGFSLYQDEGKWRGHCFKCGWHGDGIDLVQRLEGLDHKKARSRLKILSKKGKFTHTRETSEAVPHDERKEKPVQELYEATKNFILFARTNEVQHPEHARHVKEYCANRFNFPGIMDIPGISRSLFIAPPEPNLLKWARGDWHKRAGLYSAFSERFLGVIYRDWDGREFVQARFSHSPGIYPDGTAKPKSVYPRNTPASSLLFLPEPLEPNQSTRLFLTEGGLDAISMQIIEKRKQLHQLQSAGIIRTSWQVAGLLSAQTIPAPWIQYLGKRYKHVVYAHDQDKSGEASYEKIKDILGGQLSRFIIPGAKDVTESLQKEKYHG